MAHLVVEPRSFYFGTPVVLISSLNEDGSPNLAPMSSAWWMRRSCMLGLSTRAATARNLMRERECVLNLPSWELGDNVDRLGGTTGLNPVPESKVELGYRYEPDKFGTAQLTTAPSDLVKPPRAAECPVQLEAVVENVHPFGDPDADIVSIEVRVVRAHIDEAILVPDQHHYIDRDRWRPIIFSFGEFFNLTA
ncbi:hypothetical protein Afil01_17720 [Actinorhabdospora filicis]|uniref:Flavin reductase like domain-containing protein n=1 Tax=Actinorhabdospora filicis TaxID=1785913 RepID=A0A9W6SJ90_9ACTN|nr:flavin reductase family protein [Actinorhabdospora filicis]GLZ76965.1 hypothetical protein Afil01_17720 [Actinorhabdospora filicis]